MDTPKVKDHNVHQTPMRVVQDLRGTCNKSNLKDEKKTVMNYRRHIPVWLTYDIIFSNYSK